MSLNKEIIKKGIKNQLIAIWHMIVFNVISFILFMLSYIDTKTTGNIIRSLFAVTEYKANLFFVIFSWLLFLISFSIFYTRFLKKDLKKQLKLHRLFVIIFIIVSVLFCFVEIILLLIAQILNTGIFSTIVNFPNNISLIIIAYIIGYIIFDFIRERREKLTEK